MSLQAASLSFTGSTRLSEDPAPLLSRLPGESWQSAVVEPSSFAFCTNEDGSLVELGRGASGTASDREEAGAGEAGWGV